MTLFKYGLYAVVFYYCNGHEMDGNFSIHALLLLAIAVLLSFSEFGFTLPSSRLTEQLGKYSLSIYIFHGTFRYVFTGALKNIGKDPKSIGNDTFILFTLITLAMCVILTLLTDFMKPHCKSLWLRFKEKLSE